jgi:ribosomal protein S18 acetylase RimI-like enzyme
MVAHDSAMSVRAAEPREIDQLARLWYDGWHEAHAPVLPAALTRLRTLESFRDRLQEALLQVRVLGAPGDPAGFSMVKGSELYQLYVSPRARGAGVAATLITDAERRIAESGADIAWLSCAIGNERAARFYEKRGWRRVGTMSYEAETSRGPYLLEVWRYEKSLNPTVEGGEERTS